MFSIRGENILLGVCGCLFSDNIYEWCEALCADNSEADRTQCSMGWFVRWCYLLSDHIR